MDLNGLFFFLGTNIQTNEEVAIKLVSNRIQVQIFLPFSVYIDYLSIENLVW